MLRIDSISSGYGRVKVLHDVSIDVAENEVVAVLGTNGAGKSTLLRTVSGLVQHTAGSISVDGVDVGRLKPWDRVAAGLAHVPEGRQVFPSLTVLEHLEVAGELVRGRTPRLNLEFVHHLFPRLQERTSQRAGTLSGGEQQMLAIGRALMSDPKVLMLDEPSHGLAPVIVEQLGEKIAELSQHLTVVLVEQNLALPRAVASRFVCLENGVITMAGDAAELEQDDVIERAYLGGSVA